MTAADATFRFLLVPLNALWAKVAIKSPSVYSSLEKNCLSDQSTASQLGALVVMSQARWRARVRPV
jgi:hypothetical protein